MTVTQIAIIAVVILALGLVIFPLINRWQFMNLPPDQQIRIIMKQAKGLIYFKNISRGSRGILFYVKNKRKILAFPWVLSDGKMLCTKKNPFACWDYPEEKQPLDEEERSSLISEIEKYNKKNPVKIVFIK